MDHERLNLAALDPAADSERWERTIASIRERAQPELQRRRLAARNPLFLLASWARPMLSAAAVLAAVSVALLSIEDEPAPQPLVLQPEAGVAAALQIPDPMSAWLDEERAPTIDDLLLALEGDLR